MDGPASHDGQPVVTTTLAQRTHRQRGSVAVRRMSHVPTFSATSMRGSGTSPGLYGDAGKTRRGSIRHAVRKIFGRTSRDGPPRSPRVSAPMTAPLGRHAYHKSEPTAVLPVDPPPVLPYPSQDGNIVPQTIFSSHSRTKTSSPYAVSFPKSVMLKPRDLGNPFGPDAAQMKRRKTMPNTGIHVRDGADAAANVPVPSPPMDTVSDCDHDRHARRAKSQSKKARRKSRSTDDLIGIGLETSPRTKRSDEIQYWRETFQPDVLRASGFTSRAVHTVHANDDRTSLRQELQEDGEQTPVPPAIDTFPLSPGSSPTQHTAFPAREEHFRPSSPVDLSKDLEQRVLKLEAGLNSFQRSLERMTADRNRRTIVLRSTMTTQRSSNDLRTPSMLADTLFDSLEPSSYVYEYGRTLRPSASANPRSLSQSRNHYEEPFVPMTPRSDHYADSTRLPTPPYSRSMHSTEPPLPASLPRSSADSSQQQQHTFHSVYQMLSDERSARQKLESQLRHLQHEISELHAQVNTTSHRPNERIDRNSYMLAGSSARLQQLLQETEDVGSTRASELSACDALPITSRFSGSESETGYQEQHEPETPYGAYLTPREERSTQSLADKLTAKDDDFDCMF